MWERPEEDGGCRVQRVGGRLRCSNLTVLRLYRFKERDIRRVDLLDAHLPEAHVTDPPNGAVDNGAAVALAVVVGGPEGGSKASERTWLVMRRGCKPNKHTWGQAPGKPCPGNKAPQVQYSNQALEGVSGVKRQY